MSRTSKGAAPPRSPVESGRVCKTAPGAFAGRVAAVRGRVATASLGPITTEPLRAVAAASSPGPARSSSRRHVDAQGRIWYGPPPAKQPKAAASAKPARRAAAAPKLVRAATKQTPARRAPAATSRPATPARPAVTVDAMGQPRYRGRFPVATSSRGERHVFTDSGWVNLAAAASFSDSDLDMAVGQAQGFPQGRLGRLFRQGPA